MKKRNDYIWEIPTSEPAEQEFSSAKCEENRSEACVSEQQETG